MGRFLKVRVPMPWGTAHCRIKVYITLSKLSRQIQDTTTRQRMHVGSSLRATFWLPEMVGHP